MVHHVVSGSLLVASLLSLGAKPYQLTISPADHDRRGQVVAFALPVDGPKPAAVRDTSDRDHAVQIDASGLACFVIAEQPAGRALAFTLVEARPAANNVVVTRARADLGIAVGDRRTIVYQTDKDTLPRADIEPKFKRAAYLHPIMSPAGVVVTGDYPSNHVHHHGIWTSWSRVQFQGRATNFWESAEQKGTTEFAGLDRVWNGPVYGGFVARQQMIDLTAPQPVPALNETWEVTTYHLSEAVPAVRIFDLAITQTCSGADPVLLPKHLYGGLGFRGRDEWNGKDKLLVLTSEGATTRESANMTRVRWCAVGGEVEGGRFAGIAILSHPDNIRTPEAIRVHPDMPFVCFAPVQTGDLTIAPGKPYLARYRFVVFDGSPDRGQLEAYWRGFAEPAAAKIPVN